MLEHIKHLSNYLLLFVLIVFSLNSRGALCFFALCLTVSHIANIVSNIAKSEEIKCEIEATSNMFVILACLTAIFKMTLSWT